MPITSSFATVMMTNSTQEAINGPNDLAGKTVGTILGSTGEVYCRTAGLNTQLFKNLDSAVEALEQQRIVAIVYDSPILGYYVKTHPAVPLKEVGSIFEPRKYGFALPRNSSLRVNVNEQLLTLSEDGFTSRLSSNYFGTPD